MSEHWMDPLRPIGEAADAHEEMDRLFPWADPDDEANLVDRLRQVAARLESLEEIRQRVADRWVPEVIDDLWHWVNVQGDEANMMDARVADVLWPSTED